MQLLKITSVPMQYETKIQNASLQFKQPLPKSDITTTEGKLQIQTENPQMRVDGALMRDSMDIKTNTTVLNENAQRGRQNANEVTGDYTQIGYAMTQPGADISKIMAQKLYDAKPVNVTVAKVAAPEISWQPGSIVMNYSLAQVSIDWDVMQNSMEYIPSEFSIEILEYNHVEIEYVGGFNYAPPSSDPNYKGDEFSTTA